MTTSVLIQMSKQEQQIALRRNMAEDFRKGQTRIPCPFQVVNRDTCITGLDFLKFTLKINWLKSEFMNQLGIQKSAIQDTDDSEAPFTIGNKDFHFNLQRTGGGKYAYILKQGDITLLFSNHKPNSNFPNCKVEIGSVSCWSPGWKEVYEDIIGWLSLYGAVVKEEKVAEFHIMCDLLNVDFTKTGFINLDQWVRRSTKFSFNGEIDTIDYMRLGKGKVLVRLYDKSFELKRNTQKAAVFYDLYLTHLGYLPEYVTRIEFQLRRTTIKDFKINTVAQLERKLNSIWKYCVTDWCRHSSSIVDRKNKNQQRAKNSFLWNIVQGLVFNKSRFQKLKRYTPLLTDVESLVKQGVGCLLTACASFGLSPEQFTDHIETCCILVNKQIRENFTDHQKYIKNMQVKHNYAFNDL